jgi:cytoskeletal protein CcmA (bactofilin family)
MPVATYSYGFVERRRAMSAGDVDFQIVEFVEEARMFGSKSEEPTVIGRGAVIEGTVRVRGRVQVDGRVEGTLEVEGMLSVGPEGRVSGEVIAEDIAVGGEFEGKITAK